MKSVISLFIICAFALQAYGSAQNYPVSNSGLDGSVWQVKHYLDKTLKDPKSFEAITWGQVERISSTQYLVFLKYRAKNSFGGYIIESQTFYINNDGDVYNVKDGRQYAPPINKTAPRVATVKFMGHDCRVVEQGDLFIRIVSPRRLSAAEIIKGFADFKMNDQILYICEANREKRGSEYASISDYGLVYDLDKEKCKFVSLKK